jgi:hypothetical protein
MRVRERAQEVIDLRRRWEMKNAATTVGSTATWRSRVWSRVWPPVDKSSCSFPLTSSMLLCVGATLARKHTTHTLPCAQQAFAMDSDSDDGEEE